jgi:hypothetical protein
MTYLHPNEFLARLAGAFEALEEWETKAGGDAPLSIVEDICEQFTVDPPLDEFEEFRPRDDYDDLVDRVTALLSARDELTQHRYIPEGWATSWADRYYEPGDDTF